MNEQVMSDAEWERRQAYENALSVVISSENTALTMQHEMSSDDYTWEEYAAAWDAVEAAQDEAERLRQLL
jgi:hypothetical protein